MTTTITPHGGAAIPVTVTGYHAERASLAVVHEPIGAAAPIVTRQGVMSWRRGSITYRCSSLAAARAVEGAHAGRVRLTADDTAMSMTYVATSVRTDAGIHTAQGWRWDVTAEYREVGA